MISYEPFWATLKEKKISTYKLLKDEVISPTTLQRFRRNESVNVHTIDVLCQALDCTITDIVEILPTNKPNTTKKIQEEY